MELSKHDIKAFRKWLQVQPSKALVGKARSFCECPIANYLEVYKVFPLGYLEKKEDEIPTGYALKPMPVWMRKFIGLVDVLPITEISAELALELLLDAEELENKVFSDPIWAELKTLVNSEGFKD